MGVVALHCAQSCKDNMQGGNKGKLYRSLGSSCHCSDCSAGKYLSTKEYFLCVKWIRGFQDGVVLNLGPFIDSMVFLTGFEGRFSILKL